MCDQMLSAMVIFVAAGLCRRCPGQSELSDLIALVLSLLRCKASVDWGTAMAFSNGCGPMPTTPLSPGVKSFAERHECAHEVAPATLRMTGLRVTALSFLPS